MPAIGIKYCLYEGRAFVESGGRIWGGSLQD